MTMTTTTKIVLIKTEAARRALAEARSVDEVKDIRDKAEAVRQYAKQAGYGLEMINDAAEIKLRAERKAGELLKGMEKHPAGRPPENRSQAATDLPPRLVELGITKDESSRWQRVAKVPEEKFEQHITETRRAGDELSTAGVLRLAGGPNYKRDAKSNRAGDVYVPQGYDACQTPAYALDPLLPYIPEGGLVWEPARGEGLLEEALYDSGLQVIATDLLTGTNFFDWTPERWDYLITNPPFSLKYLWLARCYALQHPFALLLPVETLGAKTAQDLFKRFGVELILLDKRIDFKMPHVGWAGGGAQFPVAWFTWGLRIGQQLTFAEVTKDGADAAD